MNDRAATLLEQYNIEVLRTRKGRGAILCDTNCGCLIFKEYTGNEEKIQIHNKLLTQINESGLLAVEQIIHTKNDELFVRDHEGNCYILKTYFEGRECNIHEQSECMEAIKLLAILHSCMELSETKDNTPPYSPLREYEKHNKELKKVRQFLKQKSQKNVFEIYLQQTFDYFLEQAIQVTEEWSRYEKIGNEKVNDSICTYCHGDYQYHNIINYNKTWCIINFEKCVKDNCIRDVYFLLRKLLEKSNWSIAFGVELLQSYESYTAISAFSKIDLYYRLAYPEKFWKISNFYFNSGKAWIPEKNLEKLQKLVNQEKEKQHFLDVVFRKI